MRQPINIAFNLDHLSCYDEGDGSGNAEPYMWTVYFKIDGTTCRLNDNLMLEGTATILHSSGSHDNLGSDGETNVDAGDTVHIPSAIGFREMTLVPIPVPDAVKQHGTDDVPAVAGCIVVLMEEDNISDEGAEAGHNALNSGIQNALNDLIPTLGFTKPDVSDEDINNLTSQIQSQIEDAVINQQNAFENLWSWTNPDDTIGTFIQKFSSDQLNGQNSITLNKRWTNDNGDWELFGEIFTTRHLERYAAIWDQKEGIPWQASHGLTSAQYQRTFDAAVAKGFMPIWISGYRVKNEARYAAIFEKRNGVAWQARHGLTNSQYQQTFDQLNSQGYRPVCVSGYSINGQDYYAAIFYEDQSVSWQARHGLTSAAYQQVFDQLTAEGYKLTCVSGYSVNGSARYAAIFDKSNTVAWQARHGLTSDQYQQTFDEMNRQGYRPVCISGYELNNRDHYAVIFEKRTGVPWVARHGLNTVQYQQVFDQLSSQGYRPVCVSGYALDH